MTVYFDSQAAVKRGLFVIPARFFCFFCEMPGAAPIAPVGAKFHGRVGCGDLVFGRGEGCAFSGVFALAAHRTFGGTVHQRPLQDPIIGYRLAPDKIYRVD